VVFISEMPVPDNWLADADLEEAINALDLH
jgi:hypothetical protein